MNRLKEIRSNKKLSQKELAIILGVAQNTISQWETEKRDIDSETLTKISNYFDVSIDYILNVSTDTNPTQSDEAIDPEDKEILAMVKDMPNDQKKQVRDFIEFVKGSRDKDPE